MAGPIAGGHGDIAEEELAASTLDRIERRLADGLTLAELVAIRGQIP